MNSTDDTIKPRILIIDDNRSIHKDFEKILAPHTGNAKLKSMEADIFGEPDVATREASIEFELDHALQGQEGYEMTVNAKKEGRSYALAFVDMRMPPGWDGLETIEWLWQADADLQIVICSAYSDHTWAQISDRLGYGDKLFILQKPFSEAEVLQFAHSLTEKRNRQQQSSRELLQQKTILAKTHEALEVQKAHVQRMERELVVSQKLKNAGQLTAGVSHEISMLAQYAENNAKQLQADMEAINNLLGLYRQAYGAGHEENGQLLAEAQKVEKEFSAREFEKGIQSKLIHIMQATQEMLDITNVIKEFDGTNQSGKKLSNLNSMIINLLKISRINYEYITDIKTDLGVIPPIYCHAGDINQTLTNLLMNAVHAIAATDNASNSENKGSIHITTARKDDNIEISIQDSGGGIPEEIQADIFKPFFTTKEAGNGSGQGLPIARDIIENNHGGTLSFETEPGFGTIFTIQLPIQN